MKIVITAFSVIVLIVCGWVLWKNILNPLQNENKEYSNSNYQATKSDTSIKKEDKIKQIEIEIAKFSTKIHNKDMNRQNNIAITCKAISTKEIAKGEIFSFCDVVGKATPEKGYAKADIYVDGKKEQGFGGGNCQVSTTLYNAVLQIPELEVIERHKHSGYVPYIEKGKDAAVSYGTYDFKFKNNTNETIKIIMESTEDDITAKILKIQK